MARQPVSKATKKAATRRLNSAVNPPKNNDLQTYPVDYPETSRGGEHFVPMPDVRL